MVASSSNCGFRTRRLPREWKINMIRDEAAQDRFFNPKDEADPVEADETRFLRDPRVDID